MINGAFCFDDETTPQRDTSTSSLSKRMAPDLRKVELNASDTQVVVLSRLIRLKNSSFIILFHKLFPRNGFVNQIVVFN